MVAKNASDRVMSASQRITQRGSTTPILGIYVRPMFQQKLHHVQIAVACRHVQRRALVVICSVHAHAATQHNTEKLNAPLMRKLAQLTRSRRLIESHLASALAQLLCHGCVPTLDGIAQWRMVPPVLWVDRSRRLKKQLHHT
eukprot:6693086-Prymnesium_polylepis.1